MGVRFAEFATYEHNLYAITCVASLFLASLSLFSVLVILQFDRFCFFVPRTFFKFVWCLIGSVLHVEQGAAKRKPPAELSVGRPAVPRAEFLSRPLRRRASWRRS